MAGLAPGLEEIQTLEQGGFSQEEIDQYRAETTSQLQDAGFNADEIDAHFGVKKPDMKPMEEKFKANIQAKAQAAPEKTSAQPDLVQPEKPMMKEATSFVEAVEAGFDMSITGLIKGRPDVVLPEHAPMFYRIAAQVSQLAGDIPAMIAGGVGGAAGGGAIGGAAGTVTLPVVGTVGGAIGGAAIGAAAGSFALPEGMRTAMMEHYEKGDVQSFSDFWERTSAVAISTLKGGAIGAVTAGVGGAVAKGVAKVAAPTIVKTSAQLMAEAATMTTAGAALEGKVPEPQDFIDAAILVGGMHGAIAGASKIRKMYAKGGATPLEIAQAAEANPKLKQEMAASNVEMPKAPELGLNPEPAKPPAPLNPDLPVELHTEFQTIKPLKEPNPNLSAEVNTILGKVGEQADAPKKSLTTAQVYTAFVDKLDPINQATKILTGAKELPAESNPYILARTAVDAPAKAKHMFENGVLDFSTLENKGGSLKSALKSVESVETLEAYMISKRVLEKNAQGVKTGFDVTAAEAVVKEHGAKYEAAAKKVTDFSNGVLDYAVQSGVVSKESAMRMKEANKDYVPFKRIMEADGTNSKGKRSGKAGSLKEFKGSDREIQSPILSIVENSVELIKMAENNRPKKALIDLAAKTEGQELIRSVPPRMEPIKVHANEIIRALEEQGVPTLEKIKKDLKSKGIELSDDVLLKAFEKEEGGVVQTDQIRDLVVFRKAKADLGTNQFAVYENGKAKVFETTPELAEAIKRLDGDATSTNLLFKLMHGVTAVKKFGITFTPDFIIKNFFRDTLTASTFSKSKGMSPLDLVSAVGDIWKKNDHYYEWLKSGGANGAFIEMGDRYVKTDIYQLQKDSSFMGSARNIIEKPIEVMRVAAELSEQSVRLAEFKNVRKAGGSLTAGGYASREITVDFQRVGAKVSALNSITAFMNVSIQGLDRTARAFKENPTATATKSLAYITAPSVLLWWANHDDPRYQEIPRWEKDMFWIIPTDSWQKASVEEADGLPDYLVRATADGYEINKGHIYRLPKPQELGVIFGSLPERVLESYFNENPGQMKGFSETMLGIVTPTFVPDAVAPPMEQYFNKSLFTGRDIVPQHLRDVLPEYQYVEYTSEPAKILGKMIAPIDTSLFGENKVGDAARIASPIVIDNYIRSWGGSIGQYVVQAAGHGLRAAGLAEEKVSPTLTLSDIPVVKSFAVRFPSSGSNSVQDFQDSYRANDMLFKTIKFLAKEGDFKNLEKEVTLNSNQDKLVKLDGINEGLKNQAAVIRMVSKDPEMTPDEKRQMIDGAYLTMIEIAKAGNEMMREIKKELGE